MQHWVKGRVFRRDDSDAKRFQAVQLCDDRFNRISAVDTKLMAALQRVRLGFRWHVPGRGGAARGVVGGRVFRRDDSDDKRFHARLECGSEVCEAVQMRRQLRCIGGGAGQRGFSRATCSSP